MIIILVKQDDLEIFPRGWAEFVYEEEERAQEHWDFIATLGNRAQWISAHSLRYQNFLLEDLPRERLNAPAMGF